MQPLNRECPARIGTVGNYVIYYCFTVSSYSHDAPLCSRMAVVVDSGILVHQSNISIDLLT